MNRKTPRLHHILCKTSQGNFNEIKPILETKQNSPKNHLQRNKKLALVFSAALNSKRQRDTGAKYIKLKVRGTVTHKFITHLTLFIDGVRVSKDVLLGEGEGIGEAGF